MVKRKRDKKTSNDLQNITQINTISIRKIKRTKHTEDEVKSVKLQGTYKTQTLKFKGANTWNTEFLSKRCKTWNIPNTEYPIETYKR